MTKQFQVGQTYATRSICDYDCIFTFAIVGRTEKSVKVTVRGEVKTCKIAVRDGVETIKPHGSYSMCTILGADDTSDKIEAEEARRAALAAKRAEEAIQRRAAMMGDAGLTVH